MQFTANRQTCMICTFHDCYDSFTELYKLNFVMIINELVSGLLPPAADCTLLQQFSDL